MQKYTPLSSLPSKKRLTAFDAGRALVQNMVENTLTRTSNPLPANVVHFLTTMDAEETVLISRFNNLLLMVAQQRSIADTHRMRLNSFLNTYAAFFQTSMVMEHMLDYFEANPANTDLIAAAYSTDRRASFVGFGVESLTDHLNSDWRQNREDLLADYKRARQSLYYVTAFNTLISIIAQSIEIEDLNQISIGEELLEISFDTYNSERVRLIQTLRHSHFPYAAEKLAAVEDFPSFTMTDVSLDTQAFEKAQVQIEDNLSFFDEISDNGISHLLELPQE